ncbi:MAG: hypothetical protein JW941_06850 [Candidatus Coatesbacteria bacterium]|nr:hypothetical protein [Candidatus Coatesbacteria bacterium]
MSLNRLAIFMVVFALVLSVSLVYAEEKSKGTGLAMFSELTTKKVAPKPRVMSAAFLRKNELIICGGGLETLNPQGDLWKLDLKTKEWSQITPVNGDLTKIAAVTGIYDEKRDRLVVLTQKIAGALETAWYSFAENKWNIVPAAGDMPKQMVATVPIYDPKADAMVFAGGSGWENPDNTRYRTVFYGDTFSLSLNDLKWKKFVTKGDKPLPRNKHTQIYDPKTHSMIIFGGIGTDETGKEVVLNDVWSFDLAKAEWKKLEAKGIEIEPRLSHCAVLDPIKRQMIVFGGTAMMDKYFSDMLSFDLETLTWSRIKTKLPVTLQLAHAAAVWDPTGKRALFFGGVQPGRMLMNSVWELVEE